MNKCKRYQFCKKLTSTLLKDRRAAPFSAPVKELWHTEYIPDYFNIISHPMDLGTVRKNLETRLYVRPVKTDTLPFRFDVDKFANDVRLVFRNAIIYNREGDLLHNDAHCLLEDFERTMKEQLPVLPRKSDCSLPETSSAKKRKNPTPPPRNSKSASSNRRGRSKNTKTTILLDNIGGEPVSKTSSARARKVKTPQPILSGGMTESELDVMSPQELKERLNYLKNCREAVVARMPIPKGEGYLSRAALLYDIPICNSQIQKCIVAIRECRIDSEKMPAFVELIKQCQYSDGTFGKASLDPDTGVFEAELDQLDNKAWRNIEAFLEEYVPKFKTVRSSSLGREFSTVYELDSEIAMTRNRLASHADLKSQSKEENPVETPKSFFADKHQVEGSSSDSSSCSDSDASSSSSSDSSDESASDSD